MFQKDWHQEARTLENLNLSCEQLLQTVKKRKSA